MVGLTFSPEKFETVVSVILRVPGYFILDYSYQNDLLNCIPKSMEWPDVVSSGFAIFGVLQGILVLMLPLEKLVKFYMYYLTIIVLAAADTFSHYYIETEKSLVHKHPEYESVSFQGFSNMLVLQKTLFLEENDIKTLFLKRQVSAIVFHTLGAILVTFFLDLGASKEKILLLVYLVPVFARLAGYPVEDLHLAHNFASCFVIFIIVQYIFLCMPRVFRLVKSFVRNFWVMLDWYGTHGLLVKLGSKLFVPVQLLIFWLALFFTQIYSHLIPNSGELYINILTEYHHSAPSPLETTYAGFKSLLNSKDLPSIPSSDLKEGHKSQLISKLWHLIVIQSAAEVCFTPLMLVGMCVGAAYFAKVILKCTYAFTAGPYYTSVPDNISQAYWTGITMAFLALQTSLPQLSLRSRVALLSIIFRIILSWILQNMFEVVEPIVLTIGAQGVGSLGRHVRAWVTMTVLLFAPMYMVYELNLVFDRDIWLLIVASANVLTSIQSLGLFITYLQSTYESLSSEPWPSVDDHIYYTRVVTRVCEFLVALFLVIVGVRESFTGEWSFLNALVIILHTYFNIYQRLQLGWKTFLSRREANKRISQLSFATSAQIEAYDDRCAICFSDMTSGVITRCHHIFHVECLQRCLYVQDNCPLCHSPVQPVEPSVETKPDFLEDYDFGTTIPYPDDYE